ncbi:acyltransferase family protein [Rubritalea tangerina]|uniref:Acyltransferase family protein n=2 Tax=Rubritalea tangerina TaxID=430798 RepID=A0ABW4Z6K5_9BACT
MGDSKPISFWQKILSQFSRVTSSGNYMPEIDGLRFVSIMAVLLYHAHILFFAAPIPNAISFPPSWDWLNFAIGQGWFGVQVFFVISGFVLALPFANHYLFDKRKVDLKTYYSRRVVRIGLPYFIALTLGALWMLRCGMPWDEMLHHYLAGLLYSHSLLYAGELNPILYVSWTLEIEIQFYLLAPLLCRLFMISSPWFRRASFVIAIFAIQYAATYLNTHFPSGLWSKSIIGQLQFFLVGLILGDLYLSYWKNTPRQKPFCYLLDCIGAATWLFIPFALKINGAHKWLALLLLLAFICVLRGSLLNWLLSRPLFATIGGMCYSIYLFHGALLYILHDHLIQPLFTLEKGQWPTNLLPLATLTILTLIVCSAAYKYIERPSMLWGSPKK